MTSRPLSRAEIIDRIESLLNDSANTTFSAARLGTLLEDAITEISEAVPYVSRDIYTIESRFGNASSTSASNLVDSSKSQFASGDTGKVVYNKTDKTWAVITSFSSTSQVGLSNDIFTSGEPYEIYNKGCWNRKQINIENSDDFIWVIGAVYPVLPDWGYPQVNMRNVKLYNENKIAEIDVGWVDDSGLSTADKDVHVYFARQHKLNDMTDLLGAVNNGAGYAAGSTSIILKNLQTSGTLYKDTLFTIALASGISSRLTYRVTADATITTNAATITFTPGLESAIVDSAVVTFTGSTLTPELERIIVPIVAGEALMSQGVFSINRFSRGGTSTPRNFYDIGERMAEKARRRLKSFVDVGLRSRHSYSRS
uniref:Uncharacterized protein n=1 Tax=viral metagenome TaxID=1070528 RepID=A0A6M3XXR2_9ZZZZ